MAGYPARAGYPTGTMSATSLPYLGHAFEVLEGGSVTVIKEHIALASQRTLASKTGRSAQPAPRVTLGRLREGQDISVDIAKIEFLRAVECGVQVDYELHPVMQLFIQILEICDFDIKCL